MTNDPEVKRLLSMRAKLAERVADGKLTPLEALQRLHAVVDYSNQSRWKHVRNWGRATTITGRIG